MEEYPLFPLCGPVDRYSHIPIQDKTCVILWLLILQIFTPGFRKLLLARACGVLHQHLMLPHLLLIQVLGDLPPDCLHIGDNMGTLKHHRLEDNELLIIIVLLLIAHDILQQSLHKSSPHIPPSTSEWINGMTTRSCHQFFRCWRP